MSILANSNAIESGGYNIDRSLRFRSSASAYLNRTPASASNQQKWTWSGWAKIGALGGGTFFAARTGGSGTYTTFSFYGNNQLVFQDNSITVLQTAALFRDASAWYHFVCSVDTTQATQTNRIVLYVNGVQVSWSTGTFPTQNYNLNVNSTATHLIGQQASGSYFDGYLAEVNFIDGQALTPSSFGQTDATTGSWVPKKYTGTYGTNGFYLPFTNTTSATTLAYDKSGNGNNWTANNISTTAGATYDSMTDVPTLTSATAANFCVANPLDKQSDISVGQGNLYFSTTAGNGNKQIRGTIALPLSGKFYWETKNTGSSNNFSMGISDTTASLSAEGTGDVIYNEGGYIINNGSATSGYATLALNDVVGVAVDVDANKIYWYKNNTLVNSGGTTINISAPYAPMFGLYTNGNAQNVNFGQQPFFYTPPTGFKALNTFNLPDPTIKKPNQYMDVSTYTGTNAAQSITNSGSMQPDMVWIKGRNVAASHNLFDSVRGPRIHLASNLTDAEYAEAVGVSLTAFNSNGFALGTDNAGSGQVNANGNTYVGWQWKESATAGFDIVTYTGNGTSQNISHSLGIAPKMMFVKSRSQVGTWWVYNSVIGNGNYLKLNGTDASASDSGTLWNGTSPTSSVFSVGNAGGTNYNGVTYVAYLFAEIPGFSKFGSFSGNGSTDGPFVYCGFRPKYVMIKDTTNATQWVIKDGARNPSNVASQTLFANLSNAEESNNKLIDMTSNGFKVRVANDDINTNAATIIFAAFAENPFKYSNAR